MRAFRTTKCLLLAHSGPAAGQCLPRTKTHARGCLHQILSPEGMTLVAQPGVPHLPGLNQSW